MTTPTRILTRRNIASLMRSEDYVAAVEAAFLAERFGRAEAPPPMHLPGEGGTFHGKGAVFSNGKAYVALKLNGNFPDNPRRFGLPCIQGAILLCNAQNGALLAILDSIEITLQRTAAASALAARYLSRNDAGVLCVCGCGAQGRVQAEALAEVRSFTGGFAWDIDRATAQRFAAEMTRALGFAFEAVSDLGDAARKSDVIVTATTSRQAFLHAQDVKPGAFIAAVGADNPEKSEIAPELMARAKVVVDSRAQCLAMGDLRVAIEVGAMTRDDVYADLGEIVAGRKPGRSTGDEIFVFDSTGTALEDVASAAMTYEKAVEYHVGSVVDMGRL